MEALWMCTSPRLCWKGQGMIPPLLTGSLLVPVSPHRPALPPRWPAGEEGMCAPASSTLGTNLSPSSPALPEPPLRRPGPCGNPCSAQGAVRASGSPCSISFPHSSPPGAGPTGEESPAATSLCPFPAPSVPSTATASLVAFVLKMLPCTSSLSIFIPSVSTGSGCLPSWL